MKKVLSPSSEKRMRRKPETAPSVKGLSPMTPFFGGGFWWWLGWWLRVGGA